MTVPVTLNNGDTVDLPKLTVREYLQVMDEAYEAERANVSRTCTDAGLDAERTYAELQLLDVHRGRPSLVWWYILKRNGLLRVLEVSAKRAGVSVDDIAMGFDLAETALAVCSIEFKEKDDAEDAEASDDEYEEIHGHPRPDPTPTNHLATGGKTGPSSPPVAPDLVTP